MSAQSDDDSDDDFGPMPVAAEEVKDQEQQEQEQDDQPKKKRARHLKFESVYVDELPSADFYEHSYMHRDVVTHIAVSKETEFVITGSQDGHVKFWKKMSDGIEFVKHYQAHLAAIHAFVVSPDGKMLVTTSADQMVKFFEISGFDMSNMISLEYTPDAACWLLGLRNICDRVAVADKGSGAVRVYAAEGGNEALHTIEMHASPVRCLALNIPHNCVISADKRGMIEYWDCSDFTQPGADRVSFTLKSDTDLYDLAKCKAQPLCVCVAPTGMIFATYSSDKQIRVFDFARGKLLRRYDESVAAYVGGGPTTLGMDALELGKRQAMERELEATPEALGRSTMSFDTSGHFLIFGSLKGVKVLNVLTNKVVRTLGMGENERFLTVAVYQGVPKVDQQFLLSRAGAEGALAKTVEQMAEILPDPTVYCTSFKKRRFYCFSRREPDEGERDKLNELPTEEEREGGVTVAKTLASQAIMHTTMGDITIKLFPDECPLTIENFATHCRNGYYNNLIFHRVIKNFMLQCGDPKGDGTGGTSIWGTEFEDECVRTLRHDRPFTVSMANAGPGTNGSQFFITTKPTPWLDDKHTVFGRVTKGFEVATKIENVKVNKTDKPYDDIKIISIEVEG
ncbi:hypothetical protein B484DRAFT_415909 [Ochromonadaceae sp. CCMP2298]|nr:hypothetical protein B484DRAFT_416026 [Ochromonadaceae sp. CCMP2298]KAJ1439338.1 hypothetical protein B484DRAFT_415909 [Ochromonadaceae sp. CCMP2298]